MPVRVNNVSSFYAAFLDVIHVGVGVNADERIRVTTQK